MMPYYFIPYLLSIYNTFYYNFQKPTTEMSHGMNCLLSYSVISYIHTFDHICTKLQNITI